MVTELQPIRARRTGRKPFLYHLDGGQPERRRTIKLKAPRTHPTILTAVQVQAILDACTRLRDRFLFAVLWETGIRIGEALGLRHEDLAAAKGELAVIPRVNDNRARAKSASPRAVPVGLEIVRLYADYLHAEYGDLDSDYMFVNLWGGSYGAPADLRGPDMEAFIADPGPGPVGRTELTTCGVPGCRYGAARQGLCASHHGFWERAGEPEKKNWITGLPAVADSGCRTCRLSFCTLWAQGKSPFCHNHKSRWYAVGSPDIEEFARRREAAGDDRFDFRPLHAKRQLKLEPQYALQCRHDERQVNTHSSAVSPVIRLAASGPVGSLEACQDVLMQVARNIAGFQGRSRFSTWLHVVIANGARQTYRGLKRRAAEQGYADMPVDTPDARTTSVIAGSRLDLLDALKRLEASRPELVAPMVLRDICQLDYKEIARHLAIPEGTVKSRIHQARGQVRAYLLAGS